MTDRYLTGDVYYRDQDVDPAPRGTKLILLNPDGVAVFGDWQPWCQAWHPLIRVGPELRDKITARRLGKT